MANAKIIGIHDGKHIETDTTVRPLPMPIIKLRDQAKEQIKNLLRQLFENADDALFAMSDKAGTNGEQGIYLDAMRELRLQKKYIANAFLQHIVLSFNNVTHLHAVSEEHTAYDDFENLSLLKNEELEINVALEGMASRLRGNSSNHLTDFQTRIEYLVNSQKIDHKYLPASPEVLCDSFASASADLCHRMSEDLEYRILTSPAVQHPCQRQNPALFLDHSHNLPILLDAPCRTLEFRASRHLHRFSSRHLHGYSRYQPQQRVL